MNRDRQPDEGCAAAEGETLAQDVHEAMRLLGWTAPVCDEDVLRAEAELAAKPPELPRALQDPNAVFDRPAQPPAAGPRLPFPANADIDATLARAARECGHITPEIEEAMRRDREAAERERDRAQEDP